MDGLSVAASIISVLQLTYSVAKICHQYKFKIYAKSGLIVSVTAELKHIAFLLESIRDLESKHSGNLSAVTEVVKHGVLDRCRLVLTKLQNRLQKDVSATGLGKLKSALLWPLKEKELHETLTVLERHKTSLSLALDADTVYEVLRWLSTNDTSLSHVEACGKRATHTGRWLCENEDYIKWKSFLSSVTHETLLCLYGIPGSGKTVLCSRIVDDLDQNVKRAGVGIAFFYFNPHGKYNQGTGTVVSALISQLCCQINDLPKCVELLHEKCNGALRQPRESDVVTTFKTVMDEFTRVFLVFDAIEKCLERQRIFDFFDLVLQAHPNKLRLLVTSQREEDIEEELSARRVVSIEINNSHVEEDIRIYVRSRLQKDIRLKSLPLSLKQEIEGTLIAGPQAMQYDFFPSRRSNFRYPTT
ncbi:hypothetical protein L228DRAFT_242048 [Xylona heveae TC161]|uniref:Nephrocystin 3-like N-terminal domain-containing protein n=1 Tax=Xylona heveae (strain CBS 132557 / TC161) TaxID=1328760 RepID=A0A164ZES0_XYLHT|nr:hypothetical protein L228DRAFT_242048 [Xylona heveae TC161]KZF19011.1 hypothetical protein L228DRAFT_242048 [Xylona heveae TC161]